MSNYTVGYFVGSLSTSSINRLLAKALSSGMPRPARTPNAPQAAARIPPPPDKR